MKAIASIVLAGLAAWLPARAGAAWFIRGDTDAGGQVDLTDAVRTLGFLYLETPADLACLDAADANDDGAVDVSDAVQVLFHLFLGASLPAPSPACGVDPTDDDALECGDFAVCGAVCGGKAGIPCAGKAEFCLLPPGSCCCDFPGVCRTRPRFCPKVFKPVCGCDGVTYGNECEMEAAGMSMAHEGPCEEAAEGR